MAYTREPLSGSTHGRGIKVTGTGTGSSVTVHTGQASTTLSDIVTIYAYSSDTVGRTLTLEWGGTSSPDDHIKVDVPPVGSGLIPVAIDLLIRNSLVVKAFAETANVIVLFGYVNTEA
jgi:hypothetical protein